MNGRVIVVTGTDTEVGKTFVTAGLARALVARGLTVVAIKPVESGVPAEDVSPTEDGAILAAATGQAEPTAALQRLRTPVAPPVAADAEGVTLFPEAWRAAVARATAEADIVLVEGAGGLLSPLTWDLTALGLARELGAAALVVGADKLGTLNHTKLTLRTLESAGVEVLGVALSAPETADHSTGLNVPALAKRGVRAVAVPRDADVNASCWTEAAGWLTDGEQGRVSLVSWAEQQVDAREAKGLRRRTAPLNPELVNFSGNDYLGLSAHPRVVEAARAAMDAGGMGPRGSALVCGYTLAHEALESRIAAHCGAEAALLLPTGYAANVSAITALAGPDCAIFSDALNHASIIDGCRLARRAGAAVEVYPHGDVEALDRMLSRCERPRRIIVTESVFSMDGDRAPLDALAALRDRHGAWLVCDEAHATLLFDPHPQVDLHIGTLSKAVGALGGFIAGPRAARDLVLNVGRPFVFSTALPVPVVAAAREAFEVAADEPELRDRVFAHVRAMSGALGLEGQETPIVPIMLGTAERTMAASAALRSQGFHIPGIRPPTVPKGTSRLRIALSATHLDADVARLADALRGFDAVRAGTA